MEGKFGIGFYLIFFVFFYSKCNICDNNYHFNEELSSFKIFFNSNFSIFNSEYYFYIFQKHGNNITLIENNTNTLKLTIQINDNTSVSFFNNNSEYIKIDNKTFYDKIKYDGSKLVFCINNITYKTEDNETTLYNYQFILNDKSNLYGNFLIIFGIIISLYGYKKKFIGKIIFLIFFFNSLFEFLEENFINANIYEVTCLEISIFCLIMGIFLGIILPKKEFISYGIIFGFTFYKTICYYFLYILFPNLINIFQIIGFFIIIIFTIITQIYHENDILFIIGTSMSGAYFIITGINCFIGGFYYGFFLKKGYYDLSTFANNIFFYFVLNIIFIVVGIIYQIYYKDIETNETNEIENAKKKINKNFSGSTFIVNPNKTNEYNVSLTTNEQINSVGNDNLNENNGNDEEEKDIEDNENDDKLLNESYH